MATVVVEVDSEPSCSIPNPTSTSPSLSHRFLDSKFYLLVVIGELVTEEHLRRAIANIERGEAAGAGAPQAAPRHPPPAPCSSLGAVGSRYCPRHPSCRAAVSGSLFPGGSRRNRPPAHLPPRGAGAAERGCGEPQRAPSPPSLGGGAGPGAQRPPPSPSARRHRRVGVARSALRSRWQPGADKGRLGMGWMGWAGAAGRLPPAVRRPPPPRQAGEVRGVFPLGGRDCAGGSAAAPLCLTLGAGTFLSSGELFRTQVLYMRIYIPIKKTDLSNKAVT